ncbi:MAG TPA: hypothetical protein VJ183_10985 [Chloroflexia bacterium]|nr:hypothetical protein [Chloroflexia bacterium]
MGEVVGGLLNFGCIQFLEQLQRFFPCFYGLLEQTQFEVSPYQITQGESSAVSVS